MIQFDDHIFQMGLNHQLGNFEFPQALGKTFRFFELQKIVKIKSLGIWSNQKWEMILTVVDVFSQMII